MRTKWTLTVVVVAVLGNCLRADAVEPAVPIKAQPFSLNQVRLLDGPFKKAMEINKAYLLKLDADRMLWPFHQYAGLPTKGERYGGWAQKDCVGHEAGHYLSACALMYASTGDEELKKRVDYMVERIGQGAGQARRRIRRTGAAGGLEEGVLGRHHGRCLGDVRRLRALVLHAQGLRRLDRRLCQRRQQAGARSRLQVRGLGKEGHR